jgi:hypothetical protein
MRTFDFELPEAERCLRDHDAWNGVHVVGVEVIPTDGEKGGGA